VQSPHWSSSVALSIGTEKKDTWIIKLASAKGVLEIKPPVGLTSRSGVIPIHENVDSVGSFGSTVADVLAGLNAIPGEGEDDPLTKAPGPRTSASSATSTLCSSEVEPPRELSAVPDLVYPFAAEITCCGSARRLLWKSLVMYDKHMLKSSRPISRA